MNRSILSACILSVTSVLNAQADNSTFPLKHYLEAARQYSPLVKDRNNQILINESECERLKAFYTRSRLEVNGDYLFVPIISLDGGRTSFKWNATDAGKYYGYDLGESSGHLHAGLTWTQPLLGNAAFKVAQEQSDLQTQSARHDIRMELHQLERSVTEQYLLCLLDKAQTDYTDSVASLLDRQESIVRRLNRNGLAKQSDLHLIEAQREANAELRTSSLQSYHTHLLELNLMCGIDDTASVRLEDTPVELSRPALQEQSIFTEQYKIDSASVRTDMKAYCLQYRPRLDAFVNGGMQTGNFKDWQRHFGWSFGLTFSWTLFDGRQKRWKEQQMHRQLNTIQTYSEQAGLQRRMRQSECLSEISRFDSRERSLDRQLAEYDAALGNYEKEIAAGLTSVLDYLTVLQNRIQTEKERLLLRTNRRLAIAAYNYWNK